MVYLEDSCTKQCTLSSHGETIAAALTKRDVTDAALCAYLNYVCESCASSRVNNVYPLHIAASCGRTNICRWLICQKQARVDEKDGESFYTALHRSIFYGKIDTAITLTKLGANLHVMDHDYLTPLDHALQDNLVPLTLKGEFIYMWGSNSNYTIGPLQGKQSPELLEMFHKANPNARVGQVCLGKFHTIIVTVDGYVYIYGMGLGGRLGLGSEKNCLEPHQLDFGEEIIKLACSARDHSMFLNSKGVVYSCGSNSQRVLGLYPPPKEQFVPRIVKIPNMKNLVVGISCSLYHSVAWSVDAIYTWGTHAGQLGHEKSNDAFIVSPRIVSKLVLNVERKIISVATSQGATAIAVNNGDVYILHEYQCRKIVSRELGIQKIELLGGTLDSNKVEATNSELKLVALTSMSQIFIWTETDPQLNRCILSLNREINILEVALHNKGLLLLSAKREVFKGIIKPRKKKSIGKSGSFHTFLDRPECSMVQIERVSRLYGTDSITCDLEGENFAAITINVKNGMKYFPDILMPSLKRDIKALYENEDLMDVTFKLSNRTFKAHKIIVANASDKLSRLIAKDVVIIDFIHPDIFEQILKFIYTGICELITLGTCPPKLLKITSDKKLVHNDVDNNKQAAFNVYSKELNKKVEAVKSNPLLLLQEAAKKLEMGALFKHINTFVLVNDEIKIKSNKEFRVLKNNGLSFENFPDISDVDIYCKNGNVLKAHRCILSARCEYFSNMFSMRWIESTKRPKITLSFPQSALRHLLSFLYTDNVEVLEDIEALSNLLILADHLLLPRLITICESYLSSLISLKNLLKILELAHIFNAMQLKRSCLEYICLNLAYVLETRLLENVEVEILEELTKFYEVWNKKICNRVITPYSNAESDEIINSIAESHPISMDFEEEVVRGNSAKKTRRKRGRSQKISTSDKNEEVIQQDLSLELEDFNISNVNVSDEVTIIPQRLQAIKSAREKLLSTQEENCFVPLNKSIEIFGAQDFPDLLGKKEVDGFCVSPPDSAKTSKERFDKHRMQRLSQKQRKRLSSSENESIKDAVIESPKNPWKIVELTSPVGSPEVKVNMDNIITHEKLRKENFNKIKSKLLIYTQMEDKALEELSKFYNADNIFDEIISVERVSDAEMVAAPSWFKR